MGNDLWFGAKSGSPMFKPRISAPPDALCADRMTSPVVESDEVHAGGRPVLACSGTEQLLGNQVGKGDARRWDLLHATE